MHTLTPACNPILRANSGTQCDRFEDSVWNFSSCKAFQERRLSPHITHITRTGAAMRIALGRLVADFPYRDKVNVLFK